MFTQALIDAHADADTIRVSLRNKWGYTGVVHSPPADGSVVLTAKVNPEPGFDKRLVTAQVLIRVDAIDSLENLTTFAEVEA